MRKGMFGKLALDNIKRNRRTYIPYMITCIFCIAMTYIMFFINQSPDLKDKVAGGPYIQSIMLMGIFIVSIFSVIFLLYSNGFLMKQRQKEIGLYNILGMEKAHIGKMLCVEMVVTFGVSFLLGIGLGILGSKLALLFLFKLIHVPAQLGFNIAYAGIGACAAIYGAVFILTLLKNMRKIHLNQPVELLRGSKSGEREPKAKWIMAIIGFVCIGVGYYIAITTESPLQAITLFFVAVLLVMAGTYLVFTSGSIAVLKIMRWKKSFYYKTKNFTAISGMLYRMKQNAVGLASICILSTGVLLMLSATTCLDFGIEDIIEYRYPYEAEYIVRWIDREQEEGFRKTFEEALEKNQVPAEDVFTQEYMAVTCLYNPGEILIAEPSDFSDSSVIGHVGEIGYLNLVTKEEYEKIQGADTGLQDGEILVYRSGEAPLETMTVNNETFRVKGWLKEWPLYTKEDKVAKNMLMVVTENDFRKIDAIQREVYKFPSSVQLEMGMNIDGTEADEIHYGNLVSQELKAYLSTLREKGAVSQDAYIMPSIQQEEYWSFYTSNGGLLFIGIFLGLVFLLGTAMIIYYKQISEGYEDKERFEIMQKVGMSRKEVKSSIRRQILMVFFLPLITAMIHICAAFPLIRRLLMLFGMTNTSLFMVCTAVTALVFAVIYGIIYTMTAKVYYKIVERKA